MSEWNLTSKEVKVQTFRVVDDVQNGEIKGQKTMVTIASWGGKFDVMTKLDIPVEDFNLVGSAVVSCELDEGARQWSAKDGRSGALIDKTFKPVELLSFKPLGKGGVK